MIIYSAIYRNDGIILSECVSSGTEGNFRQATEDVVDFVMKSNISDGTSSEPWRRTFVHENDQMLFCGGNECLSSVFWYATPDETPKTKKETLPYYFQIYKNDNCVYLCISDDISGRMQQINFSFLDEIQSEFIRSNSTQSIIKAKANSFKSFQPKYRTIMHSYNTTDGNKMMDPKVASLTNQIEDLKNVMGYNINLVLKRDEDLNDLLSKASQLEEDASVFQKRGTSIKKVSRNKYYRTQLLCLLITILLALGSYLVFAKKS